MASTGAPSDTVAAGNTNVASTNPESRRSSTISVSPEKEKTIGQAETKSEEKRRNEEEIDELDDDDDDDASSVEEIGNSGERKGDPTDVEKNEQLQKVASRASKLSKRSKFSVTNEGSIPNGGFRAWLQVLGAFFLFFNTW